MADATKVVPCNCKHEQQDELYGKGRRLANYSAKQGEYRCTVCGTNHRTGNSDSVVKKGKK